MRAGAFAAQDALAQRQADDKAFLASLDAQQAAAKQADSDAKLTAKAN